MRDVVFRPVEAIPLVVVLSSPLDALGLVGISIWLSGDDLTVGDANLLLPRHSMGQSKKWW